MEKQRFAAPEIFSKSLGIGKAFAVTTEPSCGSVQYWLQRESRHQFTVHSKSALLNATLDQKQSFTELCRFWSSPTEECRIIRKEPVKRIRV